MGTYPPTNHSLTAVANVPRHPLSQRLTIMTEANVHRTLVPRLQRCRSRYSTVFGNSSISICGEIFTLCSLLTVYIVKQNRASRVCAYLGIRLNQGEGAKANDSVNTLSTVSPDHSRTPRLHHKRYHSHTFRRKAARFFIFTLSLFFPPSMRGAIAPDVVVVSLSAWI